jgi:3-deoxy-D-manno-octulosonate 8-phosphate phosphatase (KDO 8-P phosphatase)
MSIELIVLDVDGSMTDGRIIYSADGDEIKSFNVKDGLGIASWVKLGRKAAIITGRRSSIVESTGGR